MTETVLDGGRPAAGMLDRLAAERDRWVLWTPVALGTGIAAYFALPVEPPGWSGVAALLPAVALALAGRRRPALALVALAEATGEAHFRDAAARLGAWVIAHTADGRGPGGFTGGIHGGEAQPRPLTWKSTEHAVDLDALFRWLDRLGVPGDWQRQAEAARSFIEAHWEDGRFLTGTGPDGVSANRATSGLDAQLWPQLLSDAPARWREAVARAEKSHGVPGGFSFNDDRDGLWTEGTAQAALVYRVLGDEPAARRLLDSAAAQRAPGGYLWATPQERLRTGLAIGPDSTEDDFFYYRLPHLGATAWAVLAEEGWNPFTGRRVGAAP